MRGSLVLLATLLVAGCLSDAPDATGTTGQGDREAREGRAGDGGPVEGPSGGPATETTRRYEGTVVSRVTGEGGPGFSETGDSATFCFHLPTNVTLLRGVFTYEPRQQAGLEFHGPGAYANSWDGSPLDLVPESPITVELAGPAAGDWFVAGGPGSVGAMMDWILDLTMVTAGEPSAEAVATFEDIDPAC